MNSPKYFIFAHAWIKYVGFQVITVRRGGSGKKELVFDAVKLHVNKMDISFGRQLFIDGKFTDATSGKKLQLFNPNDESLICDVESAGVEDVDKVSQHFWDSVAHWYHTGFQF